MTAPALEDLIVEVAELDRGLLAGILVPYVRLDRDYGVVLPRSPGWDTLTNEQAIVVYLLACRALHALGLRSDWYATPKEIALFSGMSGGSVRPALQRLLRHRRIEQRSVRGGYPAYLVPLAMLLRAQAWLPQSEA